MEYIYDGTYEGLLSCIFIAFRDRVTPAAIKPEASYQPSLLEKVTRIATNDEWATRVIRGLDKRTDSQAAALVYKIFLSELPQGELLIYQVINAIIRKGDASVLENFADPCILRAKQIEKMIYREVHRMHAFVRFQKSREGLFYAAINPDFNVLPLIGDHFERRYADQSWLIFDTRRDYGLFYDREQAVFVNPDNPILEINAGSLPNRDIQDEKEREYQSLWKNYFHAVNIRERNNKKLHLRHMPRRYWKYLIEKN